MSELQIPNSQQKDKRDLKMRVFLGFVGVFTPQGFGVCLFLLIPVCLFDPPGIPPGICVLILVLDILFNPPGTCLSLFVCCLLFVV